MSPSPEADMFQTTSRRIAGRIAAVAAVLVIGGCGTDTAKDATTTATPAGSGSSTSASSSSTTGSTTSTEPPRVSTDAPSPTVTFVPQADDMASQVIGKTIGQAAKLGFEVHQQSPFGKTGEWTLFTVTKDGKWMAFTATNVDKTDDGSYYKLDDKSRIVGGQTMPPLPDGQWYGVEGVTRNGKITGGVMMQGKGYDRETDNTFPVVKAFRVNLTTLRLDEAPTAGLDIEESCG